MLSSFDAERIETWASDFADSPAYAMLAAEEKSIAVTVALEFLKAACAAEDSPPESIGEAGARAAMLDTLPLLDLPADARRRVPEIAAAFLETLQDQGRLGGGRSLALFVRALGPAYRERCRPEGGLRVPPTRRAAPAIGRNDPCPCGSGRKFKKCCGP